MAKKPEGYVVQLVVNSTAEQSEDYKKVLCSIRGVSSEVAKSLKSISLDLDQVLKTTGGIVPERYDGLAVMIVPTAEDYETEHYSVPVNFSVVEMKEQAYKPTRQAVDFGAYLKSLGVVK